MGAKNAEYTDDEKRDHAEKKPFVSVEEMKDSLRPPRVALIAPLPDKTIAEQLAFSDTALARLTKHLEGVAADDAMVQAKKDSYSESGYKAARDAVVAKWESKVATEFQTIADAETVAAQQGPVNNRHARRSRARFDRDPQKHAQIAADARLRYGEMPSVRLVQACAAAAGDNDLATAALLHEVIESRDDGPRALSRVQRAEAVGVLDRLDYGERDVAVTLAKMQVNAARARLAIFGGNGRVRIALGLLEQRLAAMERALKARGK